MAQRVNPISLRLGLNLLWDSQWYSSSLGTKSSVAGSYASLLLEDRLLRQYLTTVFESRGFFVKRILLKRSSELTLIFLEIYGNPYFRYALPRNHRRFRVLRRVLQLSTMRTFLEKMVHGSKSVYLSVQNLFLVNRVHRGFFWRLQRQFSRFRRYRFALNILGIFSLVLRTKGAAIFGRVLAYELEFIEKKKKNKDVWRFVSFLGKLVGSLGYYNKAIHGIRIQLKGRFRGIKRPKKIRFREGSVPFNTFRALVDYSYTTAITVNGSFGLKVWICYRSK